MSKLKITLEDLFNIPTAEIYNPDDYKSATNVTIDSRSVKKNSIFFAIKGEKIDGHKFVENAIEKGAAAIVVSKRKLKGFNSVNIPIVSVKDTTIAYGDLARIYRKKLNAKVVGITGSNGKTSTKDFLATILEEKYKVKKSFANNNNHIGVPLTIFTAEKETEVLVLEQGTNHFGEIDYTAKISLPDYAIITNINESHTEFLVDREGVYKEKSALLKETEKVSGTVFINSDDSIIKKNSKEFKKVITYGFKGKPDIKGNIAGYTDEGKTKLEIKSAKKNISVTLPLYGSANAKNYLAVVALAIELGLTKKQIFDGTKKLNAVKGRLNVEKINSTYLIDDTYNANPESMIAGFELLKQMKVAKNKVTILGDMFELGKEANLLHASLADSLLKNKINKILLIGQNMKALADQLENKAEYYKSRKSLSAALNKIELENSVFLVKGSRGMKMEEFYQQLSERLS